MDNNKIRETLVKFVDKYSIISIVLFGSRAEMTNTSDSDVDLIVEFSVPVSLVTLSQLKIDFEEALGLNVDVVHGPVRDDDLIEVKHSVVLYAA